MEQPQNAFVGGARVMAGIFGLVFGGIGVCVLGFLWMGDDGFHSPPLFFRIFGSLIAVPFVAIGASLVYGAIMGKPLAGMARQFAHERVGQGTAPPAGPSSASGYRCPRCGAPLGKEADVSPSGDVKCTFCNAWFNIHRANT